MKANPPSDVGGVDANYQKEEAEALKEFIGHRCETKVGGKRGEVKFVGKAPHTKEKGYWVGIQLDSMEGDWPNSTMSAMAKAKGGHQFFKCNDNFGLFVRPNDVNVGDYPEIDKKIDDQDVI